MSAVFEGFCPIYGIAGFEHETSQIKWLRKNEALEKGRTDGERREEDLIS